MKKSDMDQVFEALHETFGIYAQALGGEGRRKVPGWTPHQSGVVPKE